MSYHGYSWTEIRPIESISCRAFPDVVGFCKGSFPKRIVGSFVEVVESR